MDSDNRNSGFEELLEDVTDGAVAGEDHAGAAGEAVLDVVRGVGVSVSPSKIRMGGPRLELGTPVLSVGWRGPPMGHWRASVMEHSRRDHWRYDDGHHSFITAASGRGRPER